MTAEGPAPIVEFLDWIVAIAEGRAADSEPAAIKVAFKLSTRARASQPDHLPVGKIGE
jgi:hypothetical protein